MITELEVLSIPHIDKDGVHLWVRSLDDDQPLIVVDGDNVCPYCGSAEWYTDISISVRHWRWTKYLCGTSFAIGTGWILTNPNVHTMLGASPQTDRCRMIGRVSEEYEDDII